MLLILLLLAAKIPLQSISPYNNVAMGIGGLVGVAVYSFNPPPNPFPEDILGSLQIGSFNTGIVGAIFLGAVITAKWNVLLAQNLPLPLARKCFGGVLSAAVLRILWQIWWH